MRGCLLHSGVGKKAFKEVTEREIDSQELRVLAGLSAPFGRGGRLIKKVTDLGHDGQERRD